jgi:hypothetical protein
LSLESGNNFFLHPSAWDYKFANKLSAEFSSDKFLRIADCFREVISGKLFHRKTDNSFAPREFYFKVQKFFEFTQRFNGKVFRCYCRQPESILIFPRAQHASAVTLTKNENLFRGTDYSELDFENFSRLTSNNKHRTISCGIFIVSEERKEEEQTIISLVDWWDSNVSRKRHRKRLSDVFIIFSSCRCVFCG